MCKKANHSGRTQRRCSIISESLLCAIIRSEISLVFFYHLQNLSYLKCNKDDDIEKKESEVFKDLIIEIKNEMHEKYVETQNSNISFEDFVENFYFHVGYVLRKKIACAGQMLMDHGMPFPEAKNTLFDLLTKDDAEILAVSNSIFPGSKKYVVGCCR